MRIANPRSAAPLFTIVLPKDGMKTAVQFGLKDCCAQRS
jgi:hypothetical protein